MKCLKHRFHRLLVIDDSMAERQNPRGCEMTAQGASGGALV